MYTLRCTAKLLKQMRTTPDPTPPASTTRLGDWYANRIQVGRTPIVLAVRLYCSSRNRTWEMSS